jgi:hypothetical protein
VIRLSRPYKGLVNRRPINNSLDKELYDKFHDLHERTGLPKSKLLDEAVKLVLKKYENMPSKE